MRHALLVVHDVEVLRERRERAELLFAYFEEAFDDVLEALGNLTFLQELPQLLEHEVGALRVQLCQDLTALLDQLTRLQYGVFLL